MAGLHIRFTVELYVAVKRIHFKYGSLKLVIPQKEADTAIKGSTKRGFLSQNKSDRGQI